MPSQFAIRLDHPSLYFSAAHFISLSSTETESLHGHNYFTTCTIEGPLNEEQYVLDFLAVRGMLAEVLETLDHRILLPDRHPRLQLKTESGEIEVRMENRRWVFPHDEVLLLPVENTTTEKIAQWIATQFVDLLDSHLQGSGGNENTASERGMEKKEGRSEKANPRTYQLTIELEESPGMKALCRLEVHLPTSSISSHPG
jgi:6-pyruvoyltetrahydropterin/6-carboxytetrahydropterin synthase